MIAILRPAILLVLLLTALTGFVYPLAITGIAQAAFPVQANGSPVQLGTKVIGSALVGQQFTLDRYFHPRPSAADYNASASSGSNYGPLSAALLDRVKADVTKLREGGAQIPVPADAVTASASGLDPDISLDYAGLQAARVASARGIELQRVVDLIAKQSRAPQLGIIGQPRVNVLDLNLALDAAFGASPG